MHTPDKSCASTSPAPPPSCAQAGKRAGERTSGRAHWLHGREHRSSRALPTRLCTRLARVRALDTCNAHRLRQSPPAMHTACTNRQSPLCAPKLVANTVDHEIPASGLQPPASSLQPPLPPCLPPRARHFRPTPPAPAGTAAESRAAQPSSLDARASLHGLVARTELLGQRAWIRPCSHTELTCAAHLHTPLLSRSPAVTRTRAQKGTWACVQQGRGPACACEHQARGPRVSRKQQRVCVCAALTRACLPQRLLTRSHEQTPTDTRSD